MVRLLDKVELANLLIKEIERLSVELIAQCVDRRERIAVAESCTGGLISSFLTAKDGASTVFDSGFVTYSNESKSESLGVSSAAILKFGAVSEVVAIAMAEGAISNSSASISISVTGVAGPRGGTNLKPVGLAYIACAQKNNVAKCQKYFFTGNRRTIRLKAVRASLVQCLKNCL